MNKRTILQYIVLFFIENYSIGLSKYFLKMSGYELSRFVDLSERDSEELTCSICHVIFRNPVVTDCCLQTFCEQCINEWLQINTTCPYDRKKLSHYNHNYWSKYLCVNLALVMSVINVTLFHTLFGEISFYFKIFLIYENIFFTLILLILLVSASAIHSEAKRTYKLLNKLFICCKINKIKANFKIKV
jgi:hypothetical protein